MHPEQMLAITQSLVQDPGWWVGFAEFLEECEDTPELDQDIIRHLEEKVAHFTAHRFEPPHGGAVEFEDDELPFLASFLICKHSRRGLN